MRKMILAASASVFGMLVAVAPASALSSYQIQSDGGANFDGTPNDKTSTGGLTIHSSTTSEFGGLETPVSNNFGAQKAQQQDLSRDMSWEGTGYYLRPDR